NAGFNLSGSGASVYLFNTNAQIADSISYGPQITDRSIGRALGSWTLLNSPTPGASNSASASLGNAANLRINEWMAASTSGDDWFELYNSDALPVNLAGAYLTDDPSIPGTTKFLVPA